MSKKLPADARQAITEWRAWFLAGHEQRLQSAIEFPDRHLVDQERLKIHRLADAIAARMVTDYLARRR